MNHSQDGLQKPEIFSPCLLEVPGRFNANKLKGKKKQEIKRDLQSYNCARTSII